MNAESIIAAILVAFILVAVTNAYRAFRKLKQVPAANPTVIVEKAAPVEIAQEYAHYACPTANPNNGSFWAF